MAENQVAEGYLEGSTVVIKHRVREGKQDDYERWIAEITPVGKAWPGYLDWHIVKPIPGLTETYTIILRFDSEENLRNWIQSSERAALIEKVEPLLVTGDDFYIRSGLDFWFTPEGAKAQLPTRWKQWLVTWSAIFPLVLLVPMFVVPLLQALGLPDNHYLRTLAITGTVVALMVYVIMPRYTKLVRRWLFS